jgi:hypothetical protein
MGFRSIAASIKTTDTVVVTMPAFFNGAAVLALSNTDSSSRTITLKVRKSGSLTAETIAAVAIAANTSVKFSSPIGLDPGDTILGSCPTTDVVKVSGTLVDGSQPQSSIALESLYTATFEWDASTSSPAASTVNSIPTLVNESIFNRMQGCVLVATSGAVNYYLNPTNWSLKLAGGSSVLTGADGDVMVEIPAFFYRTIRVGTIYRWQISPVELPGFVLHPAFIKDGVRVPFRYISAYDACTQDVSDSDNLKSGLNWDNNSGAGNGVEVDVTATTGDKLRSVKGIYPMVGLQRAEFRTLAANKGTGWRQLDYALWSAVQMLFIVENQSFFSQNITGAGNTNGSYLGASGNQSDSPHTIAGAGDAIANGSTNTTTGAGVNAKPGTSFMKYRGIENLYGNCLSWADGINVNVTANGNVHITNNRADFADNTGTNHELVTNALPTASGFTKDLLPTGAYFLSALNQGGSSSTFMTDQHFASTSSNRVVLVGGSATGGAGAGAFYLDLNFDSSLRSRAFGARLAF